MRYIQSLNHSLHQLMDENEDVYLLGEDIIDPYGGAFKVSKGLSTRYPERVIPTPISESCLTGFVTGMAIRGLRPILEIMFGDFISLCTDQIINSASKFSWMYNGQVKVPIVIRTPMGGRRGYGATHSQSLEALFLNVPGLTMVAPSHFHDPGSLLQNAVLMIDNPVIFIENKSLYSRQLIASECAENANTLESIKITSVANKLFPTVTYNVDLKAHSDVTLIVYGGMAPLGVEAAKALYFEEEIAVEVIIPSLVKPSPILDILPSIKKTGKAVIAEEGVRNAGWGAMLASEIYESVYEWIDKPIKRIGAEEVPMPCSKALEEEVLPQISDIKDAIIDLIIN